MYIQTCKTTCRFVSPYITICNKGEIMLSFRHPLNCRSSVFLLAHTVTSSASSRVKAARCQDISQVWKAAALSTGTVTVTLKNFLIYLFSSYLFVYLLDITTSVSFVKYGWVSFRKVFCLLSVNFLCFDILRQMC